MSTVAHSVAHPSLSPLEKGPRPLILEDVTLTVRPANGTFWGMFGPILPLFPVWWSEDSARCWVLVELQPTNGALVFDPRQVQLEPTQGAAMFGVGYVGPYIVPAATNAAVPEGLRLNDPQVQIEIKPIQVTEKSLVAVLFQGAPLSPESTFTIRVRGIEKQGQPIAAPPLVFHREQRRVVSIGLIDPLSVTYEWLVP